MVSISHPTGSMGWSVLGDWGLETLWHFKKIINVTLWLSSAAEAWESISGVCCTNAFYSVISYTVWSPPHRNYAQNGTWKRFGDVRICFPSLWDTDCQVFRTPFLQKEASKSETSFNTHKPSSLSAWAWPGPPALCKYELITMLNVS